MKFLYNFAGLVTGAAAVNTVVNLTYSTYEGTVSSNGLSQWLGMRYAAAPVGDLRFAAPQDPPTLSGTQSAKNHGKICIATSSSTTDTTVAEDCLFLDVYAPTNATTDSKLPVMVFLSGGGFNALSNANLNPSGLIAASGNGMIGVIFNYRVSVWGFLTDGDFLSPNNGLRDQRKALEWVQKHIASFGGDPNHVVIAGASAGAASVSLHLVANGGRDDKLFAGAAAGSISFATVLNVSESQYQFDNFASKAGCNQTGASAVACLRSKTTAELQAVNGYIPYPYPGVTGSPVYMWNPVVDGDLLREVTYTAYLNGNFIKVPLIAGDDTNGGASFAPTSTNSLAESNQFMKNTFPLLSSNQITTLNQLYPNPNVTFPNTGSFYRQLSNVYGEARYMCPSIFVASILSRAGSNNSWAYRWNVEDPTQVAQGLGVPHTVEMAAIFGTDYVGGPASYAPGGSNAQATPVAQGYWASFIKTLNPNTFRYSGSAEWQPWSDSLQNRNLFNTGGVTAMETVDAGLQDRCAYWTEIGPGIKQ